MTDLIQRSVKWLRPDVGYQAWLFPGLPLALCLALLTAIGPHLQYYTLSALNEKAPNIYSSAYEEQITSFPNLGDWLFSPINLLFVMIGILAAALAVRRSKVQDISISAGLWIFAIMTFVDVSFELIYSQLTFSSFLTNACANALGGLLTSFLVFILLGLSSIISVGEFTPWFQSAVLIGGGVFAASFAYYVFFFLYQPVPANVNFTARAPLTGAVFTKAPAASDGNLSTRKPPFEWIPSTGIKATVSVNSPQRPIKMRWLRGSNPSPPISVHIYANCLFRDPAKLGKSAATFEFNPTSNFVAQFRQGGTFVSTTELDAVSVKPDDDVVMYWVSEDTNKTIKLDSFRNGKEVVQTRLLSSTSVAFSAPTLKKVKKKWRPADVDFQLQGLDSKVDIRFFVLLSLVVG